MKYKRGDLPVVDVFAGAGGLSLGAMRAGFDVVEAVELDKKALDTHARNFPNISHLSIDLSKISPEQLNERLKVERGQLAGLIGGPPCQGFSVMGHRNEYDPRNNLFIHFFRFVRELHPAFFVAENVLGILADQYKNILNAAFEKVSDYTLLRPIKVKASEYGAPTIRTRVFFIGYDKNMISDLSEEDFANAKISDSECPRVQDALLGLPIDVSYFSDGLTALSENDMRTLQRRCPKFYERVVGMIPERVGDSDYLQVYTNKNMVSGCLPTKHKTRVINRYKTLSFGQRDKISKSTKLDPGGFCPTLLSGTGREKGSYQALRPIHHKEPRVITPREAARLQGFPDWFDFQPTIWHSFRQIGNSVSPIVAEKILSVIRHRFT
jgi:DNA (cytosine-5)-methyltransferase 1